MGKAYKCNGCNQYFDWTPDHKLDVPHELVSGPVYLCETCGEGFSEEYSHD